MIKHQRHGGQSNSFPIRASSPVCRKVCWERRGKGSEGQDFGQQYICWKSVPIPDPNTMNPEELGGGLEGGGQGEERPQHILPFSFLRWS